MVHWLQIMSMVKFSPTALNFGYDFVLLVHLFWDPLFFFRVRKTPELMKSGAVDSLASFKTKTPLRDAASRIGDQQKYRYKFTSRYLNWYLFIDTCPEVIVRVRVTRTAGQTQMVLFNQNYADEVIVVFA